MLKPGVGHAVRDFAPTVERGSAAPSAEPVRHPAEAECDALRAEVKRLREQLDKVSRAAAGARDENVEQGRQAGLKEAASLEAERLAAVRDGIAEASRGFERRLTALDGLAAELAHAALARIFEPVEPMAERVTAMLARQLRLLDEHAVIELHVSSADFADPAALRALAGERVGIVADPRLRAGAARITCRVGRVDLDLRDQWAALAALLESLAAESEE